MTEDEIKIIQLLAQAWDTFLQLPIIHVSDNLEMQAAIHQAQNIILARPTLRAISDKVKDAE